MMIVSHYLISFFVLTTSKGSDDESIEMKRRMTLVSSDVTFPSDTANAEQSPSAVEDIFENGIFQLIVHLMFGQSHE